MGLSTTSESAQAATNGPTNKRICSPAQPEKFLNSPAGSKPLDVSSDFMFNSYETIQLYGGNFIDQALPNLKNQINKEISSLSDIEMSNIDDMAYASELVNKYSLDVPAI